jgi:hypothetical protein
MFDGEVSDYFWWYDVCHNKWYYEHTREICGEDCGGFSADEVEWSGLTEDVHNQQDKITVGSRVTIVSSSCDYIPEIADMIGKTKKVNQADGYCYKVGGWYFTEDELELVQ